MRGWMAMKTSRAGSNESVVCGLDVVSKEQSCGVS